MSNSLMDGPLDQPERKPLFEPIECEESLPEDPHERDRVHVGRIVKGKAREISQFVEQETGRKIKVYTDWGYTGEDPGPRDADKEVRGD